MRLAEKLDWKGLTVLPYEGEYAATLEHNFSQLTFLILHYEIT
jgi:hypothetical protein